jgi:purine catabolism regulator
MIAAAERGGYPSWRCAGPPRSCASPRPVHAQIVNAQLTEVRATEEIHQRFTELSVEGAEPAEVVSQAAALAGCPVVLENLSRQVLAYDAAGDRRTCCSTAGRRTPAGSPRPGEPAMTRTPGGSRPSSGARGQDWGRLLLRWQTPRRRPPGSPSCWNGPRPRSRWAG